ncbi:MAG: 3'-phosphoesterase / DNA ligase D / DNA repair polymerase [Nitrospira sp.]|nr:MAG: 3'-phosphoesterase / DNA ligase D / DNA repair polymerase [Nitrospira sp.]
MSLRQYWKKRNFRNTPEPRGKEAPAGARLRFVIQKHAASRLHYDFRLELDGTLKSWAVPKGPSLDPAQKRLAVHVEDHPLDYASFEGIIPAKQYGAGTVLLWDQGYWEPLGDAQADYRRGRLKFTLHGEKLHGIWNLVRMGGRQEAGKENWLLIKENDAESRRGTQSRVTERLTTSVASGRSIEQIASGDHAVWQSNRSSATSTSKRSAARIATRAPAAGARKAPQKDWIVPQLATLVTASPEGEDWVHELKYDGYRILCRLKDGEATLLTRNGHDWTAKLPHIAAAITDLSAQAAWLDGEVVALSPDGRISFQALQNAFDARSDSNLIYYVFDLLYLNGYDLREVPLRERKHLLSALLKDRPSWSLIQYSDHISGKGDVAFAEACRSGMEGLIAKQADAPYRSGRNRNWVKVKCGHRQEFVIGGFTDPSGSRSAFGALLLGVYDAQGRLQFAGRTGTGFTDSSLKELHARLRKIEQKQPVFVNPPVGSEARGVHWVKPTLVAEVAFAEWTNEGQLRHASFQGLREDKDARSIIHERPDSSPSSKKSGRLVRHVRSRRKSPSEDESSARAGTSESAPVVSGVTLSHPDRILFPDQGITKLALAQYYESVSEWILPHLEDRPLTLVRCPEGYRKACFYQKHAGDHIPETVGRIEIPEDEGSSWYMVADSLPALIGLVQMGVLELHTWGAKRDQLERPDRMILDLDPDPAVGWPLVIEGAQLLRTLLEELDLASFVKTTGGKGLHVVVPLQRAHTWDEVKTFSKAVADHLVRAIPERFLATMSKQKRKGKIFVDYLRNTRGATAVAAYSTRARPRAPVSVPLAWDELSADLRSDHFTVDNVVERLAQLRQDPWKPYFATKQRITKNMLRRVES